MLLHILITSDESQDFRLELKCNSQITFFQLGDAILSALRYSKSELTSFSICNSLWVPYAEVHHFDSGLTSDELEVYLMDETSLDEFFISNGDQALFTFDMLGDRSFFLELLNIEDEDDRTALTEVVQLSGKIPSQMSDVDELLRSDYIGKHRLLPSDAEDDLGLDDEEWGFSMEELEQGGYDLSDDF